MSATGEEGADNVSAAEPSVESTKFRFKRDREYDTYTSEHTHKHRRHHHRKHKRRRMSNEPRTFQGGSSSLPPDVAFRESLFDALGDDEGAEFWQGVYGQPIHTYSRTYEDAETGELDEMDDEQYAQYVRRRMWEKSAEGIEAAREAKRQQRRQEEETRREERSSRRAHREEPEEPAYNNFTFDFELEASLRRGEKRKEKKKWQELWRVYLEKWKDLEGISEAHKNQSADDTEQVYLRNKIAWPVESGKRKDVLPDEIEKFVANTLAILQDGTDSTRLKLERVRWHPDKIQQRYGFMNIEDGTMQGVTSVFQVLDRMWNEMRLRER